MTGLERLRNVANAMRGYAVRGGGPLDLELMGIADQIERETARDHSKGVSISTYDLPPRDEREAIAWVREHGGLGAVKASVHQGAMEHGYLLKIAEMLGTSIYDGSDNADALLAKISERLMPEGMEWPTVDGKPVVIGERMRSCGIDDCKVVGIDPANSRLILASDNIEEGKATYFTDSAEYCHRPTPKVLDADGVEIHVGDTVCGTRDMEPMRVVDTDSRECGFKRIKCEKEGDGFFFYCADELTHKLPVLAADGKPLREGETVWGVTGASYRITGAHDGGVFARHVNGSFGAEVKTAGGEGLYQLRADKLTHERPESWERLEDDATMPAATYCERMGIEVEEGCSFVGPMARDLVRRAKKLARVS